ncbi:hypothetical protein PISMIDRAFT_117336 [Pisolithus microcarpus 441]|uniref:Unplaced genomic scaffold scaffold_263, whole genome shotgun sequence n=1 Tax=Pisolithus microcarpus 441 TaxID=765257 RepID=A0A0C9YVP7_9AGAM|nr:hypothetical protein BKA83DRAFT_117336 [Pisolithus microcarpus]KIK14262.1 hypothetical protein PISMIDRAFT_117336 [Pisolithus microcarpus 441]
MTLTFEIPLHFFYGVQIISFQTIPSSWRSYVHFLFSFFLQELTSVGKLSLLNALAVACKGNIIMMSPNIDYVPEPFIFEEEDMCYHADGHFGVVDCFQWPQMHEQQYEYSVCIPQNGSIPTLHTAWYIPVVTWSPDLSLFAPVISYIILSVWFNCLYLTLHLFCPSPSIK